MTVADSEDGDLHSSPSVSPRRRLLGDSDTESLADGASTVSIHSVAEESPQLMSFTTFEGAMWQSEKRFCLSMQSICTPFRRASSDEGHSSVSARVVQERHEGGHGRSIADERGPPHPGMEVVPLVFPRMMLHQPGRGGNISKSKLVQRERLDDHQLLLNRIPEVPDLQ